MNSSSMQQFGAALAIFLITNAAAQAEQTWQSLLDEDNFGQWSVEGASRANFRIEGNVVTGQPSQDHRHNSFLCSPRPYRDFELTFSFRISHPQLNSGVQFRSRPHPEGVRGPQFEMDLASKNDYGWLRRAGKSIYNFFRGRSTYDYSTAGIYGEGMNTGWIYPGLAGGDPVAFESQGTRITNVAGWNEVHLRAKGDHIQSWQAGEQRTNFHYEPIDQAGLICLQVHGGDYPEPSDYSIQWKNLMIREL